MDVHICIDIGIHTHVCVCVQIQLIFLFSFRNANCNQKIISYYYFRIFVIQKYSKHLLKLLSGL